MAKSNGDDNAKYVFDTLLSKLSSLTTRKKRTSDIELPNKSGRVDPRLLSSAKSPYEKIRAGFRTIRDTK